MKKIIELNFNLSDSFFVELKENILYMNGVNDFNEYINSIISPVMNAILKTLKDSSSHSTANKLSKFSYEYNENTHPDFHYILENNIDIALNRRIHRTTLERITDIVEDFMHQYADKQKKLKHSTTNVIDSDKELNAITHYICTTWNGFTEKNASDFFKQAWNYCNDMLKNHFDQYVFLDFIKTLYDLNDLPNVKINGMNSKELPMFFLISNSVLKDTISKNWNYEKNVTTIIHHLKDNFPYASKVRPKNWHKLAKNYSDYDGIQELNSDYLKQLFGGMNSATAGSSSFEIRTSLPYVMYDDKCQGRKPLEVLIGAIVGHAYVMNEKNNSAKMLQEWIQLKEHLLDNPGKDTHFEFKEPLNQALFHIMKNNGTVTPEAINLLNTKKTEKKITL